MATTLQLTINDTDLLFKRLVVHIDAAGTNVDAVERFTNVRVGAYTVTYSPLGPAPTVNTLAQHLSVAWNLDHKNTGGNNNMVATYSANIVTITLANPSWQFTSVTDTAISGGHITASINNDTPEPAKSFEFSHFSEAASPCTNATMHFTATGGSGLYNLSVDGTVVLTGVSSPFSYDMPRGQFKNIRLNDNAGGALIGTMFRRAPRSIIPADITLDITNLESGATIEISHAFISSNIEPYTYSLDGTNFQTANSFAGIAPGNYTLTVKDAIGCSTTKSFVIDGETTVSETVFTISQINPIRFAVVEDGKKNHKNTISCNELKNLSYLFTHKYRNTDTITTQFKTNAAFIDTYILDASGNKTVISHVKRTENIGNELKTTATYFSLGAGRSALYFGVVDVLNPLDDSVLETVNYGYSLPEMAKEVGKYVNVEGLGEVRIDSISYSDTYDAFVAEFNINFTGTPETRKVYGKYNIQPYEVYEFDLSMGALPESFNAVIEVGTDANTIEKTMVSERIVRTMDSDNLLEIDYWDSQNRGEMNYGTGIKHKLLLEGYFDYVGNQETKGYAGDKEYHLTENTIFESQRFTFHRLSSEMAHKLRLVMAHENLIINGIKYKISEPPEITGDVNYNFKSFSVILNQGGDQFLKEYQDSIVTGSTDIDLIGGGLEASQGKSLILWTKTNG